MSLSHLQTVTSIVIFLFSACTPLSTTTTPSCDCPFEIKLGSEIDQETIVEDHQDWEIQLSPDLEVDIKNWLKIELKGDLQNPKTRKQATERVSRIIKDSNPKRTYDLVVAESFYCAYYQILCESTTFSEEEKEAFALEELNRIREIYQRKKASSHLVTRGKTINIKEELRSKKLNNVLTEAENWSKNGGMDTKGTTEAFKKYKYVISVLSPEAKKGLNPQLLKRALEHAESKDFDKANQCFKEIFKPFLNQNKLF